MHPRIGPSSSEISYVTSAPRVTPTPPNVKFAEVLAAQAGGIARSAEAAMRSLPGAPIVALAIRGPGGVAGAPLLAPRGGSIPIGVGGAGAGSGTSAAIRAYFSPPAWRKSAINSASNCSQRCLSDS